MTHNRTISNIRQAPFIQDACFILTSFLDNEGGLGVSINDKQGFSDRLNAVIILAAVIALGVWLAVHDRSKTIPAALDRKPEWSIGEITAHPEKIIQYKKDLCAWSQREQTRSPSIYNKARSESACKP